MDKARQAKKEAKETEEIATEEYERAFEPYAKRLSQATERKKGLSLRLKKAKEELKETEDKFIAVCQRYFKRDDAVILFDAEMSRLIEKILKTTKKILLGTTKALKKAGILIVRQLKNELPTAYLDIWNR